MVPLDRGPCVSSRRFAYFFLKCAPLPHKTMTRQARSFVVVPFSDTPIDDSPFSPFPTLSSFLRGAQPSDPCRGFGSLGPPLPLSCFLPGLQTATPVEDSVPPIHRHFVVILARASSERPLSRLRLSPTDCASLSLFLTSTAPLGDPCPDAR